MSVSFLWSVENFFLLLPSLSSFLVERKLQVSTSSTFSLLPVTVYGHTCVYRAISTHKISIKLNSMIRISFSIKLIRNLFLALVSKTNQTSLIMRVLAFSIYFLFTNVEQSLIIRLQDKKAPLHDCYSRIRGFL